MGGLGVNQPLYFVDVAAGTLTSPSLIPVQMDGSTSPAYCAQLRRAFASPLLGQRMYWNYHNYPRGIYRQRPCPLPQMPQAHRSWWPGETAPEVLERFVIDMLKRQGWTPVNDSGPEEIKNFHSTDSIDTETSGTRGLSIWVHSSQVGLLDSSVHHNRLPEWVGLLGTGVARDRVSTPRPARPSGAQASEPGRTSWLPHDWFDPCQLGQSGR